MAEKFWARRGPGALLRLVAGCALLAYAVFTVVTNLAPARRVMLETQDEIDRGEQPRVRV